MKTFHSKWEINKPALGSSLGIQLTKLKMTGRQPGAAFSPEHAVWKSSGSPAVIKYFTFKISPQHAHLLFS